MKPLLLVAQLKSMGVEVRHRYLEPLYRQPLLVRREGYPWTCSHYRDAPRYEDAFLPNVEAVAGHMIGLPNHPMLTSSELDQVIEAVTEVAA